MCDTSRFLARRPSACDHDRHGDFDVPGLARLLHGTAGRSDPPDRRSPPPPLAARTAAHLRRRRTRGRHRLGPQHREDRVRRVRRRLLAPRPRPDGPGRRNPLRRRRGRRPARPVPRPGADRRHRRHRRPAIGITRRRARRPHRRWCRSLSRHPPRPVGADRPRGVDDRRPLTGGPRR